MAAVNVFLDSPVNNVWLQQSADWFSKMKPGVHGSLIQSEDLYHDYYGDYLFRIVRGVFEDGYVHYRFFASTPDNFLFEHKTFEFYTDAKAYVNEFVLNNKL